MNRLGIVGAGGRESEPVPADPRANVRVKSRYRTHGGTPKYV